MTDQHSTVCKHDRGGAPQFGRALGIVGLATMGRNLALNLLDHGQQLVVWNLEPELTARFADAAAGRAVQFADSLADLVARLAPPRRILLMIQAGSPVDEVLATLTPLLSAGDTVVDGGNAHFGDTRRRAAELDAVSLNFVGLGVSGGEDGARHGPSLMFGGAESAWLGLSESLTAIAAKSDHGACAAYMGTDGAGHFVKMVHNGIEYADMQLIAEVYDLMRRALGLSTQAIAAQFGRWNDTELGSFLLELTAAIVAKPDPLTDAALVDSILDAAEQKGTGRWAAQTALELGVSVPTIAAAVDARLVSSDPDARRRGAAALGDPRTSAAEAVENAEEILRGALLAGKIAAYAQGMALIGAGNTANGWQISAAAAARVWTGGCIIRARLLDHLIAAYQADPNLENPLLDESLARLVVEQLPALRRAVALAASAGIPAPALSASLAWLDGIASTRLPQNLIQAQRDAFGAHTYRRGDDPDVAVHTDWLT